MGDDFKDLFGDWRPDEEARGKSDEFRAEPENRVRRALNEKEVKIVNVYEAVTEGTAGQTSQACNVCLIAR